MSPPPLTVPSGDYQPVAVYCGLRDQVLRLPQARAAAGQSNAAAALMETGYRDAVVTLVALDDGTTSVYFSNGSGVIGAGQLKPVASAAAAFLQSAAHYASQLQSTTVFPLPRAQHTRFYLLSASGAWTSEAPEQDLGHNRHPLAPLFHQAHAVIAAVRQHSRPPENLAPVT